MKTPAPDLIRRHAATDATARRYRRKDFDWKTAANCGGAFRFHAKKMGHKLPKWPAYRSALGMVRALRSLGHRDLVALLDAVPSLERIAPAQMMMGDVAVVAAAPVDGELDGAARDVAAAGSIAICLGPQKIIGWMAGYGTRMVVISLDLASIKAAWRL